MEGEASLLEEERFDLTRLLPHRPPFLMVDRILSLQPGKSAHARKNLSYDAWFFQGHFPSYPVMPGVLILEALAQTAGCALSAQREAAEAPPLGLLTGVEKARFHHQVRPGDLLDLHAEIHSFRHNLGRASGRALVDGELACEAELLFMLVPTPAV